MEASYGYKAVETLDHRQSASSIAQVFNDDVAMKFGTGGTVQVLYETADADANALIFVAPEGGLVDVPVFVFGDASILNADPGFFNGITEPNIAVVDDNIDHWLLLGFASDGVAQIKSNGSLVMVLSDDTDDYFTFSVVSDIPTITSTGATGIHMSPAIFVGTTPLKIKEEDSTHVALRTAADDGYIGLICSEFKPTSLFCNATDFPIYTAVNAAATEIFNVWSGSAWNEVMRIAGNGGSGIVQIGRDDTGVATNAVTDMLVLQAGSGTNNEASSFGLGMSLKLGNAGSTVEERASIDLVLTDATVDNEDVQLNFNLQVAGAAPALCAAITGTGPIFPNLPSSDPSVAGMLYYVLATGVVMRSAG